MVGDSVAGASVVLVGVHTGAVVAAAGEPDRLFVQANAASTSAKSAGNSLFLFTFSPFVSVDATESHRLRLG